MFFSAQPESFELTVGQDLAIGFDSVRNGTLNLFLMETFVFRVLEPRAAAALKIKDK